jgi:Spy/CpxP family protein refolding chaperone
MMPTRTLAALALSLGLALPAAAAEIPATAAAAPDGMQAMMDAGGPGPGRADGPGGQYRRAGRGSHRHLGARRTPTYAGIALRHRAELALNPQQVETLEKLRMDTARASIQRRADLQIAGLDLMSLRRTDPVDLAKVEAKVREIEKMRADGHIAMIRADEQGKAQLTADQREKIKALMATRWQQWQERRQRRSDSDGPARPATGEERA